LNRLVLRPLLACCLALFGASHAADARAAKKPPTVVVQDAYADMRSGPGRGFPATYSVERDASIQLLRQRTDWIKVRTANGREGWVHRSQLERTLTPGGAEVRLAGPVPEARTEHRWEVGLATGDFGGANVIAVNGACTEATRSLGFFMTATKPPADATTTERLMAATGRAIAR